MVFRSALRSFKAMFRLKPLCLVSSSCLTSIIGREYNFFVQGSMLLGFRGAAISSDHKKQNPIS